MMRRVPVCAGLLVFLAGCHLLNRTSPEDRPLTETVANLGTPAKHQIRVPPYVFLSDVKLTADSPLLRDLGALPEQVYSELRLPYSNSIIQVHLFENRERYEAFIKYKYPQLPSRRAFFVAQPRRLGGEEDLLVYTYWGERIEQDLRHELTHALLHSVLKDVPLWLDEGLAEYFEVPRKDKGVNHEHLSHLRREALRPNLARLEQLSEVQEMSPAEYRESWAWVHLMLNSTPEAKRVLIDYLQELRTNTRPGTLRPRLAAVFLSLDVEFQRHLAILAERNPTTAQR